MQRFTSTEPGDGFTQWCEKVVDCYPESMVEDKSFFESELENEWLNELFNKYAWQIPLVDIAKTMELRYLIRFTIKTT